MITRIYSADIQPSYVGRPWPYDKIFPNERLKESDLVYLIAGQSGLYGWGYVTHIEKYKDSDLQKEMMKVTVSRPFLREGIVSFTEMNQVPDLYGIVDRLDGNFVSLTPQQVNSFNRLFRSHDVEPPPDLPEIQDQIGKFGIRNDSSLHPKLRLAVEKYGLVSMLFLDLDNFKSVNDNYDHATGDQVIREALEAVEVALQSQGELFHRSGDEMIVMLPNLNDTTAQDVADRIRAAIEQKPFSVIGQGKVTTTIGLATFPETYDRWEDLVDIADRTAMKAKKVRKNWVANCLNEFKTPQSVTDAELAELELEIQSIDTLNEGRADVHIAVAKRQKIALLEKLVSRLKQEGRPFLARKYERRIRAIENEGRISTPLQKKSDRLNDIEIEKLALREEEKRKNKKR